MYKGRQVFFYKRAQILVGDINEQLKSLCKSLDRFEPEQREFLTSFKALGNLKNIERLTCFADYRIPQVLAYDKVLIYDKELEEKIQRGELIAPGSEEECEIRGNMIYLI